MNCHHISYVIEKQCQNDFFMEKYSSYTILEIRFFIFSSFEVMTIIGDGGEVILSTKSYDQIAVKGG